MIPNILPLTLISLRKCTEKGERQIYSGKCSVPHFHDTDEAVRRMEKEKFALSGNDSKFSGDC